MFMFDVVNIRIKRPVRFEAENRSEKFTKNYVQAMDVLSRQLDRTEAWRTKKISNREVLSYKSLVHAF